MRQKAKKSSRGRPQLLFSAALYDTYSTEGNFAISHDPYLASGQGPPSGTLGTLAPRIRETG